MEEIQNMELLVIRCLLWLFWLHFPDSVFTVIKKKIVGNIEFMFLYTTACVNVLTLFVGPQTTY